MELTIRFNKETVKGLFIGLVLASVVWTPLYFLEGKDKRTAATNNNQPTAAANQPSNPTPAAPAKVSFNITDADHLRGSKNAAVMLVEFSDFQCPYCSKHYDTMKELMQTYGNKIAWVLKQYPLTGLHQYAQKAAEASECASEQGKFWEYADKLMENQAGLNDALLPKLAQELKLDTAKFNSCLSSGKYASKVQTDEADGSSKGVEGTPATFVNGELVSGAIPFDSFKTIIDAALKNAK